MAGEARTLTLGAMALDPTRLPRATANELVGPDGRPRARWRSELRRIPSVRNAVSVAALWAQVAGLAVFAARWPHPVTWLCTMVAMGGVHARCAALMHEAAHRLLFANKAVNDLVGRWLLGYPQMTNTDAYRRVHMAHHRAEFGPEEPDMALYANYPVTRASMRRKLLRDATGRTGVRLLAEQLSVLSPSSFRRDVGSRRRTLLTMLGVQGVLVGMFAAWGQAHLYLVVWVVPYLTVWRVVNRLRSVAEHGGLRADPDRRLTTHSVRQRHLARWTLVPCNIGFHLAHHLDPGIPFRALPRYHRELRAAGYVDDTVEYPRYRSLWRALASAQA